MKERLLKTISLKKDKKWDKKKIIIIILLFGVIIFSSSSYAKYAYLDIKDYFLATRNFYFNCDKLSTKGSTISMTNWSGIGQYEVTFNMNSRSNSKVKSSDDIYYDISYKCSSNVTCSVKESKTNGIISGETNTDSFTIVITVPTDANLKDKDEVELTVETTSTSPYKKKLSGTFTLVVGYYGLSYEIVDKKNSPYLDINITNTLDYYVVRSAFSTYQVNDKIDVDTYLSLTDEEKTNCSSAIITLTFDPSIVLLDMTNEVYKNALSTKTRKIDGYEYISSITFSIEALSSNQIKFYKSDTSKDYTYPNDNNNSIIEVEYS